MKNKAKRKLMQKLALPIGIVMLAIALIMEKFLPSTPFFDFTEGFLMGLSIVLNVYYLVAVSRRMRKK